MIFLKTTSDTLYYDGICAIIKLERGEKKKAKLLNRPAYYECTFY